MIWLFLDKYCEPDSLVPAKHRRYKRNFEPCREKFPCFVEHFCESEEKVFRDQATQKIEKLSIAKNILIDKNL